MIQTTTLTSLLLLATGPGILQGSSTAQQPLAHPQQVQSTSQSNLQHIHPVSAGSPALAAASVPSVASSFRGHPSCGVPGCTSDRTWAIDLALCLDTSGSMETLLDAARQKLWAVVNELATARPRPRLRVALLSYGNDGHDPAAGWVSIDSPLTDDLDLISQQLFALSTNGGTELVARVVERSTTTLDWSPDPNALKLIVVAGNESAGQDPERTSGQVAQHALHHGIQINALYCNTTGDEHIPGWREVAQLADGFYAGIQPEGAFALETPYDIRMAELSSLLNETYVPIGVEGALMCENQRVQDSNAASLNWGAAASRAQTKAGELYFTSWDLVQRCGEEGFSWDDVKAAELPEELRGMSADELQRHIASLAVRRESISREIATLAAERTAWLQQHQSSAQASFETALLKALREQAAAKGFSFPAEDPAGVGSAGSGEQAAGHGERRAVIVVPAAPAREGC